MSIEVHLEHIVKAFDTTVAVNDVSLEIREGELFFLLGPSGCGKSTFLRIVAGFYQPDVGDLRFGDRVINNLPPHKRNTGMVFQNYALWPHMTVFENVEYGLTLRKIDKGTRKKKVTEVLEVVRMPEYADRPVNKLSGGQQQRIALARALVVEPDVLLLDEPLSNLDAQLRLEMRQEIKRIHSQAGTTSIYVTHDQQEALSLADRMAVMKDGKIIQVGSPREVYRFPTNAFVASFIGETNFIRGTIQSQSNGAAEIWTEIGTLRSTTVYHKFTDGEDVICSIRPESIHIEESAPAEAPNQLRAKVLSVTYLGRIEEYQLALGNQLAVKAILYNPGTQGKNIDDILNLWISAEDVIPLPASVPDDEDR
ncbi:MAG: ABC transporter ATP-binding protein [Candidatus Poribacteria bacterium]|nr:ABC transporter ATP-binding protein [Candidatus Poribacteria bacterium]